MPFYPIILTIQKAEETPLVQFEKQLYRKQFQMSENKITMTIKPSDNKPKVPQIDGMIALKKIEHYTYALTDQIGLGFSSHVYKGKNQQNSNDFFYVDQPVAVKVIDLKKEDQLSRQFMNEEINILEAIKGRNPVNLLKLYDVFKTKNNLYIITQFCQGKDVAKLLRKKKKLGQSQAQSILKQLMNAYRQLYELSVVHRDLKLANVFVRKGIIKLADFGFAISSQKCMQKFDYNVGSPYYMPPQALKFNRYSFKSDVWSFGIIAFEMIYGHLPWKEKIESILFEKITNTPVEELFESDVQVTDNYKHFIKACLQIDYDKRATPEYLINYQWPLAQDFVQGVQPQGGAAGSAPYKPVSVMRMPSLGNPPIGSQQFGGNLQEENRQPKTKTVMSGFPEAFQLRDRSPAHKTDHRISYQTENTERSRPALREGMPKQQSNTKLVDLFQSVDSPQSHLREQSVHHNQQPPLTQAEAAQNAQQCILSQIHYCRFMSNLCDFLEESNNIPDVGQLKAELITKILGKSEVLMRMRDGENIFQIEGFGYYRNTQKWVKLKDIIQIFFNRYKQKYPGDVKVDSYDHVLHNVIKNLRQNIGNNFELLEELTYFYQLKDLERRNSISYFANNSKIELLSSRKPLYLNEPVNPQLCERLNYRLTLLGF